MNARATTSQLVAHSFVKYVGSKRQLLPELRKHEPDSFRLYFEPFVGGGSLFYDLMARKRIQNGAVLVDNNELIIRTYRAVRNEVEVLIGWLRAHEREYKSTTDESKRADYYYSVRAAMGYPGNFGPDANEAARVIFTNKTGYNGLFRVNGKGKFNSPHGDNKNPTINDEENLRACSRVLQDVELICGDFMEPSMTAGRGDFVYFDPPYVKVSDTANFTSYSKDKFGPEEQERLRDVAFLLKQRGVHVVLSNADVPAVRQLYKDFTIHSVQAKRAINRDASKRGPVGEVIIT